MKKNLPGLSVIWILLLNLSLQSQEYRSFDGFANNRENPEWGAVGTNQLRITTVGYNDGISEPGGKERWNPRHISNLVFHQEDLHMDPLGLSDYTWVWGQFIDHDITLVEENPSEPLPITVPLGDVFFDPFETGTVRIPMNRAAYDESTGTSLVNPREFPNSISAFIDGSAVYGSDLERADWLRTFTGGKLKMTSDNLLPFNTKTGEISGDIDTEAPEMAMPFPFVTKWRVAGDIRANENPMLLSMHTLFAREHNRICDQLIIEDPTLEDEEIYQLARKIVGGKIQAIVYEEWLPTLGINISNYTGYNPETNPGISNVFSAAAYRYGHSVISGSMMRAENNGEIIFEGNLRLRDAFFNPMIVEDAGGIDPILKGMSMQIEQDFDCRMIDDLRNFLFGDPGAGGLDLAAININRGRERGLKDYNTIRKEIGLTPKKNFSEITSNVQLAHKLESIYQDINDIDPWVGFLAEEHMTNALFGESVMRIMELQFTALRDGDRFYYEADQDIPTIWKYEIKATRLRDIILANSTAEGFQENVFRVENPTSIAQPEIEQIGVHLYPNPTTGKFTVEVDLPSGGKAVVRVSDTQFRSVFTEELDRIENGTKLDINLPSSLPEGFYIVTVISNTRFGYQKIFLTRN